MQIYLSFRSISVKKLEMITVTISCGLIGRNMLDSHLVFLKIKIMYLIFSETKQI